MLFGQINLIYQATRPMQVSCQFHNGIGESRYVKGSAWAVTTHYIAVAIVYAMDKHYILVKIYIFER